MFDTLPDPATCGDISPAEMLSAIRQYNHAQATSTARVWAFVAMLLQYREREAAEEEKTWVHDTWAAVKDEVGAALSQSPRRASGQIKLAEALAVRLPAIARLLEHGLINARVAAAIVYRTEWVSPEAQAAVDDEIARRAGGFTTLSDNDLELGIDAVIEELDPDAARRFREAAKNCDVQFGKLDDATGTASLFGRVLATDADLSFRVLNAMAATVCRDDPRSKGELRSAGYGAVFRGHDRLVCQCANPQCPAATIPSKVPSIIIHILAEHGTVEAALAEAAAVQHFHTPEDPAPPTVDLEALARNADTPTEAAKTDKPAAPSADILEDDVFEDDVFEDDVPDWLSGSSRQPADDADSDDSEPPWATRDCPEPPPATASEEPAAQGDDPDTDAEPAARAGNDPTPAVVPPPARKPAPPAVTLNGKVIPAPLLAELIRTGASVVPLPSPAAEPDQRYEFLGALRTFIQCRDMRCRFPGCNRRAEYADIDHTTPHGADGGVTHASNGKLLCREHHLAKTFRGGPDGWRDEQSPDGEVIWTAPTGHEYVVEPTTRLVFPGWNPDTAKLPPPKPTKIRSTDPGLTMPKRKRTRRQDREQHIKNERRYNALQRSLEQGSARPPPFEA